MSDICGFLDIVIIIDAVFIVFVAYVIALHHANAAARNYATIDTTADADAYDTKTYYRKLANAYAIDAENSATDAYTAARAAEPAPTPGVSRASASSSSRELPAEPAPSLEVRPRHPAPQRSRRRSRDRPTRSPG